MSNLKLQLFLLIIKIFPHYHDLSFYCILTAASLFCKLSNSPNFVFLCFKCPFFYFFQQTSFLSSPFFLFGTTIINYKAQLFIQSLQLTHTFVTSVNFLFKISIFWSEQLKFDLKILCPAQSDSDFVEIILKNIVVTFETTDFSDVEVKIIGRRSIRVNAFENFCLNLILSSRWTRHFNNKIITTTLDNYIYFITHDWIS